MRQVERKPPQRVNGQDLRAAAAHLRAQAALGERVTFSSRPSQSRARRTPRRSAPSTPASQRVSTASARRVASERPVERHRGARDPRPRTRSGDADQTSRRASRRAHRFGRCGPPRAQPAPTGSPEGTSGRGRSGWPGPHGGVTHGRDHSEMLAQASRLATVILENGVIRTLDPQLPTSRALAVAGAYVAGGVGVHETALASPEVVSLGGRCVLAWNSHVHFPTWSLAQSQVKLDGCTSIVEALDRVQAARSRPDAGCVATGGATETGARAPSRRRSCSTRSPARRPRS